LANLFSIFMRRKTCIVVKVKEQLTIPTFERVEISKDVMLDTNVFIHANSIERRGAIYTRREVVEFMLDLIGYTVDQPLYKMRILEPSFGEGSFLMIIVQRLIESWKRQNMPITKKDLAQAIVGIELHEDTAQHTKEQVAELLWKQGFSHDESDRLVKQWIRTANFLLTDIPGQFDLIVGNPPYVRQELISAELMNIYRSLYQTIYDRADLYIPFFERSLSLLKPAGQLSFICTDRWMKNKYGGPLRKLIAEQFHLKYFVNMVGTDAFESEVMTYPAITVIAREKGTITRSAEPPALDAFSLANLRTMLLTPTLVDDGLVEQVEGAVVASNPWILNAPEERRLIRKLEDRYPKLEDAGCKVGIGVATGIDKVFIAPFEALQIEPDRKLPLVMTRDIIEGAVNWRGLGVINPFTDEGKLVDLQKYPLLKAYLNSNRKLVERRHVAAKNPNNWYRTIDRIYPEIARTPKLLIPDIKGDAHIVFEQGQYYPHHNLYYITSAEWDLRALQVVLQSGIARLFVSAYSTQMRGGYLRFQAQYLRKIRLPIWNTIAPVLRKRLLEIAKKNDVVSRNEVVGDLYGLTLSERKILL
jgi:hypothetical protein